MPHATPPAGETAVEDLSKRAKRRSKLEQNPPRRIEAVGHPVLGQVGYRKDGFNSSVHTGKTKDFPISEEKPWRYSLEVRRKHVILVVRSEDEVRVFHHVHGEKVENEIENEDFDETVAYKLCLGGIALISASADRWY